MRVRGGILFLLGVAALTGLYLISSTDLVLKERETAVHNVSVLVPDENDDIWGNFKKGMERAAIEHNVDLSFVTLYERGSALQQGAMLSRELANGAQALIVAPADDAAFARDLDCRNISVPVVSVYSRIEAPQVTSHIGADYRSVGALLAQSVKEDSGESKITRVLAVSSLYNLSDISDAFDGLSQGLSGSGIALNRAYAASDEDVEKLIEGFEPSDGRVLAALDARTMQMLSQRLRDMDRGNVALYGVGCTNGILRAVEDGVVSAAVVVNDYSIGYLSVKAAVEQLEHGSVQTHPGFAASAGRIIRKGGIYTKENEMLLFPVF